MRVDRGAIVVQPDDLSHSHPRSAHPTGHRAGVKTASITFWAVKSQGYQPMPSGKLRFLLAVPEPQFHGSTTRLTKEQEPLPAVLGQ